MPDSVPQPEPDVERPQSPVVAEAEAILASAEQTDASPLDDF